MAHPTWPILMIVCTVQNEAKGWRSSQQNGSKTQKPGVRKRKGVSQKTEEMRVRKQNSESENGPKHTKGLRPQHPPPPPF